MRTIRSLHAVYAVALIGGLFVTNAAAETDLIEKIRTLDGACLSKMKSYNNISDVDKQKVCACAGGAGMMFGEPGEGQWSDQAGAAIKACLKVFWSAVN